MSSDAGGRSLKREKILEEEQYTDALQTIIERDFFPHLDFYRWKVPLISADVEVLHANTRVSTLALGEAKPAAQGPSGQQQEIIWRPLDSGGPQSLEQWRRMRQTGQKYDLDEIMNGPGAKKPSGATTQDGGSYSFIATPDIRPGVDASPLMTWGNIESTPLLLDPSETPFHSLSGPSFKFPEKLSREVAAEQMHEEVSRKAKQKAADARAQPTARMATQAELFPKPLSGINSNPSRLHPSNTQATGPAVWRKQDWLGNDSNHTTGAN
eukprot:tig00000789_g4128.t1